MVSEAQMEIVKATSPRASQEGARLVTGGGRANRPGFFLQPTVFAGVTDDMTIAREEIFGPVISVLDFDEEDEVVARANATPFGLSGGVFTADLTRAHRVVGEAAGRLLLDQHLQPDAGGGALRRRARCPVWGARTGSPRSSIIPS
jgi:betaine-aldehyde dehydrogenase